jgi:hypothetical protein
MPYRSLPLRVMSLAAVCALALPQPAAHAAISGTESSFSSISIGGASSSGYLAITADDIAVMKERRTEVQAKITAYKAEVAKYSTAAATGDASAKANLATSQTKLKEMQEIEKALTTLIKKGPTELTDTSGTSGGVSSGGGSSSGTSDMIKQALMGAITQQLMSGGNLGNLTQGLSGLANNLSGGALNQIQTALGGGLNTGLTGGTGTTTPVADTTPETPPKTTEELEENELPACEPEATNSHAGKEADDKVTPTPATTAGTSTGSTTETNPGKAADDYIGPKQTAGTTETSPGKAADDVAAAKPKPKKLCRVVDYMSQNPQSAGNTGNKDPKSKKITSVEDAKKFVGQYWCDPSNSNCARNAMECATLTKYFCPDVGRAGTWQGGSSIKGANLAVGTCVATFSQNGGNYGPAGSPGGASGKSHTGVYLGQNSQGVILLHQWNNSGGAKISTIPWADWNGRKAQGGNTMKTISSIGVSIFDPLRLVPATYMAMRTVIQTGLVFAGKVPYNVL